MFLSRRVRRTLTTATVGVLAAACAVVGLLPAHAADASSLNVGEGLGTLIDTTQSVSPDMSDPNGAKLSQPMHVDSWSPTSAEGMYTVSYLGLGYFAFAGMSNGSAIAQQYFLRLSMKTDRSDENVLAELVRISDNSVVESHTLTPGSSASLTGLVTAFPTITTGVANTPITLTYSTATASDTTYGSISASWMYGGQLGPYTVGSTNLSKPQVSTTTYATEDGKTLATYEMMDGAGQTSTPSNPREFSDYTYTRSVTTLADSEEGTALDRPASDTQRFFIKILRTIQSDGTVVKSLYVADPTYTGTQNYEDTSTTGFIEVLRTNAMASNSVNTNTDVLTSTTSTGEDFITADEAAQIKALATQPVEGFGHQVTIWDKDGYTIRLGFNGYNNLNVRPYSSTEAGKSLYVSTSTPETNGTRSLANPLYNDLVIPTNTTHYYTHKVGSVVVRYTDEDGNPLADTVTSLSNVNTGTSYNTDTTTTTTTTPTEQTSEKKSQPLAKTGSNVLALGAAAAALSALGIGVVAYRRMRA
ncbi:hypothetical protein B9T39_05205 [Alloscardovia macacae]|uniref:MucBP domain-containing protein n=1 Tax=Alloscardovia macacae TaxID=1160091 RepID=A0A1Y2T0I4_9BIFI|nr:hypothetical protein [Alloscardovia macacae]OTA29052.1 hypothetical protein B9T39_05205 [Alloscardovia macacae]